VKKHGFTLIETLVVLLIISIIFGVTTLYFGDFGNHLNNKYKLERLAQKINFLREKSILTNAVFSIDIKKNSCYFYSFNNTEWVKINNNNKIFLPVKFSNKLNLNLHLYKSKRKRILIYPDGTISKFSLILIPKGKSQFSAKLIFNTNGSFFIYPNEQQLKSQIQ
jgi:prepilin-type N-terminal cleavage/methylation domain-containing protein